MNEEIIVVQNVTKRFGRTTALDDVSLVVQKGHVHGFLGPNGAGKTTTIKLLMDFLNPTDGSLSIFGKDAHKDSIEIKRNVGYLAGDMEFYDNLTGDQYLRYVANLRGYNDDARIKQLCAKLEVVVDRKIGTLSRGNKQKVGLVAALIDDPDLLILDEPTTGLDPLMQQKFYEVIRDHARRGKTVFMSSHILGEVQEICDVITFMKKGKIVSTINVEDLLSQGKRRVSLTFDSHATVLSPASTIGASNIQRTKTSLSFDVAASDRKVLRWISTQPVSDVTITEFNLENVFMSMYEEQS